MAFTGTPVITQLADKAVLITGVSLASSATGTISLSAGAGEVKTPAGFKVVPTRIPGQAAALTRAQLLRVLPQKAAATPVAAGSISVVKTGADTDAAFLVTLTNTDAANASGALEIWVEIV